jgi:hypothetical protein
MSTKTLPSQDLLIALLSYDPETGVLTWRERDACWFKTLRAERTWNARYAGKPAFTAVSCNGYLEGSILNASCLAHRVIWKLVHGTDPEQIDHINGRRVDNRLENLRDVNEGMNRRNMAIRSDNTSGRVGVVFDRRSNRWLARIHDNHKCVYLGTFKTLDEAIAARDAADREYGYHSNHGRAA